MQKDYQNLPIARATAKDTFEEEELEHHTLLESILRGEVSLERRLDSLPEFDYSLPGERGSTYQGSTIEELRQTWYEGRQETETRVRESLLSRAMRVARDGLEGLLFDTEEEVVISEEKPLEEKRKEALSELRDIRQQEKENRRELLRTRHSLEDYLEQINSRYHEDKITLPKLVDYTNKLQQEIESAEELLKQDLPADQQQVYEAQVRKGQDYFNRLVNQAKFLRSEIGLLSESKEKYSKLMIRLDQLIDQKGAQLRESQMKIKEAEMTGDLGVVVEAADYFIDMDEDLEEIDEITREAHDVIDAAFSAVDSSMELEGGEVENSADNYRNGLYERRAEEFKELRAEMS